MMRKGLAILLCFLFLAHVGISVLPVYACTSETTTHILYPCYPEPEVPSTTLPELQTVSKENCCTLIQTAPCDLEVSCPVGCSPFSLLKVVLLAQAIHWVDLPFVQRIYRPGPLSDGRAPPSRLPFSQKTILRI